MRASLLAYLAYLLLYPATVQAQKNTSNQPNIIIILADDMGYSDIGCFGSEIQTPNLDALAREGTRLTHFYNASRCCPTRASLLTGLYQHQAGVGHMVNTRPIPAYQGYLNDRCVTIAEALKSGGYNTFMAGKWHVGEKRPNWPTDRGFDRYYGLINGANSYFSNRPYRPNQRLTIALDTTGVVPPKEYYATDAYTDYAIRFIEERENKKAPFFLYLAYQAPHWPLHARAEDIARYMGRYAGGWDSLRSERFERMKRLGVLPPSAQLAPRDEHVKPWKEAGPAEQKRWQEDMAVYAAMVDRMDQNIGRLVQKLREWGQADNTLIFFLSDNGASNENTKGSGFTPEIREASNKPPADTASFGAYEYQGATVSNTPFRYYKHLVHEGGIASPFVAWGPRLIQKGSSSAQPAHIVDLMATCLEASGVPYPKNYAGRTILPTEGTSLLPLLKGRRWKGHEALFFEHEGSRAVRQGDWKLVSAYPSKKWELYNLAQDRSELVDLSDKFPERVAAMSRAYEAWAGRVGVVPFDQLPRAAGE